MRTRSPAAAGRRLVAGGRNGLAAARERVRDSAWSVGQCALAAGLAWIAASSLLGHTRPFFACVAAVVCLGTRAAQRLRRVGELGVGVALGVLVGDLLVGIIGTGAWQISLVIGVALMIAVALDGGPLLVAQTGLQAVFVVALPHTPHSGLTRWEDALTGAAMALLVAALLPADPWRAARRGAERSFVELSEVARLCARALRDGDRSEAVEALGVARGTQEGLTMWADALTAGRDITRLSPLHRDHGATHDTLTTMQGGVDRATRNLRVLARRVVAAIETAEPLPDSLPVELDRFAAAVDAVRLDDGAGPPPELLQLAAELDPDALDSHGFSATVIVAQLRSAVVDLLVGLGIPPDRARTSLPPLHS